MPFQIALTDDVTLRELTNDDAGAIARAYDRNREHLAPWQPVRPEAFYTEEWHRAHLPSSSSSSRTGPGDHAARHAVVGRVSPLSTGATP